MEVVAKSKYLRISPKKVNRVLNVIRKKPVVESMKILKLLPQAAAVYVLKTLSSAVANAKTNNNLDELNLVVSKAIVGESVRIKRFRARARGGAASIVRRTSNIEIAVKQREAS
jgi:large subunit ribosomal protein L22